MLLVFMAFYYQIISRETKYIQLANMFFMMLCVALTIIFVPESPRWLNSKGRYDEAKDSLVRVAAFNGQPVTKSDILLEGEEDETSDA